MITSCSNLGFALTILSSDDLNSKVSEISRRSFHTMFHTCSFIDDWTSQSSPGHQTSHPTECKKSKKTISCSNENAQWRRGSHNWDMILVGLLLDSACNLVVALVSL